MKKVSLKKLSEQTGDSTSTVFRALNGCGGISAEHAARIRALAAEQNYAPPNSNRREPQCCVVLPEKPDYFWSQARQNIEKRLKGTVNYRIALYSTLVDEEGAISALNTLLLTSPRLLIAAVLPTPRVIRLLKEANVTVFFLCEQVEMTNAFFFGADPRKDGELLGEGFRRNFPDKRRVLMIRSVSSENGQKRAEAFLKYSGLETAQEVILPPAPRPYTASLIARLLPESGDFDCVYGGTAALPEVCLAMEKRRVDPAVICVGHENPPGNRKYFETNRLAAAVCQDIGKQATACVDAALNYLRDNIFPDRKEILIPSILVTGKG